MIAAAALLLLVQPGDTPAEDHSDSPEAGPCDEARTQNEIDVCAAAELDAADAALNAQWQEALARMRALDGDEPFADGQPGYVETLRAAQRAWLTYRDQHCLAESFLARGGSLQISTEHLCKTHLTHQRTFELSELMQSLSN